MWIIKAIIILGTAAFALAALIAAVIAGDVTDESGLRRAQDDEEQIRYLQEWQKKKEGKRNARTLHKKLQSGAIPAEISGGEEMQEFKRGNEGGEEGNSEGKLLSDEDQAGH